MKSKLVIMQMWKNIYKNKDCNKFGNNTYEAPDHRIKDFPDGSVKRHPLISTFGALQTSSYGSSL